MKYFSLVWAALWRRKARTLFTLFSVLTAFLLFGMLDAVRTVFNAGEQFAGSGRMIVSSKLSIIQPLPLSLLQRIQAVPGIRQVGYANWFGGYYQDPKNFFPNFAVSDNYVDVYSDLMDLPPAQAKAFADTRDGAIVGAALAKKYGWTIGQRVPLIAGIFPRRDGSNAWNFEIVGIFTAKNPKLKAIEQDFMFHWKYFDEGNAYEKDMVGWYIVTLSDPTDAQRVAHAIDAISQNSDHETKTQTEQAFQTAFAKQIGDIGLIAGGIMAAVFFTLLLLTGNTMAQAVRERIPELAVLKTLGFQDRTVLALVLAESVLLIVLGGVLGMALAMLLTPMVSAASGGALPLPPLGLHSWGLALGLMLVIGLLVGALPALRGMRLQIVDALAGR
ncbi:MULTISPECIES: FtsX-like permease family protein [Metallibacterium]|jgi:putative ABC transport system permease protein|uniref:ABC transporter permease n=1 Tax=Metallibacterium TaxID=1218803 RepID=UPI002635DBFF|nr:MULTISPECIES: FtsX-like permease family protein [Metallibacterium]MBW8076238.1 FtsX-like permease family protein [Metallibacterium scheffleri]